MDDQTDECHNQKTYQIYALTEFLLISQKDGQKRYEKSASAHTKPTKNTGNYTKQNIQKNDHNISLIPPTNMMSANMIFIAFGGKNLRA